MAIQLFVQRNNQASKKKQAKLCFNDFGEGKSTSAQIAWGQLGAHLGPVDPGWAPCGPHEPCYQGDYWILNNGPVMPKAFQGMTLLCTIHNTYISLTIL